VDLGARCPRSTRTPTPGRRVRPRPQRVLHPPDGTESWIVYHANDSASGGNNQKWRLEDQADDTSRLVNVASGKVLDVAGCAGADGTDIRQWSWLNNTCQQWSLSPVS